MKPFEILVKNITYPMISCREGLGGVKGFLKILEEQQYWPTDKLLELQWIKVQKMLHYAYNNTKYYRRRFDEFGVHPQDIQNPSDMKRLPILTKEVISRYCEEMVSLKYTKDNLLPSISGGTTGLNIHFYYAKDSLAIKQSATHRAEKWTGWDLGQKVGLIWPARQDYVGSQTLRYKFKNQFYMRQIMCPSAILDNHIIEQHIITLNKEKPRLIRGFANPVYLVADYILQNNIELQFSCNIITTGEALYDDQRAVIEKAFNAKVFDSYGAREVSLIGQECEYHQGYHANMECNYLEYESNGKIARLGEVSDILITDIVNYGMPFIRYRIDDVGIPEERSCACGRGLYLFGNIAGRDNDILKTPKGGRVLPRALFIYMIRRGPVIGKLQIIQDRIDHLMIRITDCPMPGEEHFAYYRKTIRDLFGEEMKLEFEVLNEIPNEKSGKYRFIKCLI